MMGSYSRICVMLGMAALLLAACGGGATVSPAATTGEPAPVASTTPAVPSPAAETPGEGSEPPATDRTPPDSQSGRATGSGSIFVDGVEYEVEVAACGWYEGGSTRPLQADPGRRQLFQLVAAQAVGAGAIIFSIDWDRLPGVIDLSVLMYDPDDAERAFHFANEGQELWQADVEDGMVVSNAPIPVLDGSNRMTASRHEVEFDIQCDSFGGTVAGAGPIVADITGITLGAADVGEMIVDGERFEVEITTCDRSGSDVEVRGHAADNAVTVTVVVRPGFTYLVLSVGRGVLMPDVDVEVVADEDRVRTVTPIVGEIPDHGQAEVSFSLPCA